MPPLRKSDRTVGELAVVVAQQDRRLMRLLGEVNGRIPGQLSHPQLRPGGALVPETKTRRPPIPRGWGTVHPPDAPA